MRLFTSDSISEMVLDPWKNDAIEKFAAKLADKEKPFPCIPATQGHRLNRFRYGFVSKLESPSSSKELAELLETYAKSSREIGEYTSLIVFYEPDETEKLTVEQYEQLYWDQVIQLSEMDPVKWPGHIPTDPHNQLWEFCFHGEPYFMFCATPAHKKRRSRHFPYFMLAITPRWVLTDFHTSASRVEKMKPLIRKRLEDYDSIAVHPDLNTYGHQDNFEWKQYFLHDDDTSLSKCPFHRFSDTRMPEEK